MKKIKWKFKHSVLSDSLQFHGLCLTSSSVHGILQARILEWVTISFSRGKKIIPDCKYKSSLSF